MTIFTKDFLQVYLFIF